MRIFAKAYLCSRTLEPEEAKKMASAINPGSMVQTARAGAAVNETYAEMIAAQTFHAAAAGSLLANRPEIDFLLRMAGTTQISKAISTLGSRKGERYLLVVASQAEIRSEPRREMLELPRRDLSKAELGKIERAALLSAKRP